MVEGIVVDRRYNNQRVRQKTNDPSTERGMGYLRSIPRSRSTAAASDTVTNIRLVESLAGHLAVLEQPVYSPFRDSSLVLHQSRKAQRRHGWNHPRHEQQARRRSKMLMIHHAISQLKGTRTLLDAGVVPTQAFAWATVKFAHSGAFSMAYRPFCQDPNYSFQ